MSLLAVGFLAGLVALAVPVLLHRLKQQSSTATTVSSLMLMREADEPVRTRRALAHRVLLALRLAMLAALTLAFAQPVLDTVARALAAGQERPADLIVLDGSLSMRRASAWPAALTVARDLRRRDTSGRGRIVVASDRLTAVARLDDAEPDWSRLDLAGLSSRIETALAAWPTPPGGWLVHLVSDFQASAAPERFNALVEGIEWPVVLHAVGDDAPNWAVAADVVPVPTAEQDEAEAGARIEAVVSSFAADPRRLPVSLHRDGEEVRRVNVAVAAGGVERVAFAVPAAPGDAVAWEVRIGGEDALAADDVVRVVQAARDGRRVAVIAPSAAQSAVRFLRAGLDASGFSDAVLVDGNSTWPQTAVDCLILLDPGVLPTSIERRLARFTDDGGGVLTIVGPRTQRAGKMPLGGEITAEVFETERRVLVRDVGHPLAAGDWDGVAVARALALPTDAMQTILSMVPTGRDGVEAGVAPLLVEGRLGRGRMVVLLTALDREWSSLVLRPVFVGFVANAVDYLAGEFARAGYAGEPIPVTAGNVQLFDANGERVLALGETTGGTGSVLRVREPGLYTVRAPGREALLAVNVDPRESDLAAMSTDLRERWGDAARRTGPEAPPGVVAAEADGTSVSLPFAPALLALALALLVAESVAANVGRIERRTLRMGRA